MPDFQVDSIVWICDQYHPNYPNYVKIIEVLPEGYKAQIQEGVLKDISKGPIEIFSKEQLSDSVGL
jgi:hypothetical protein